MPSFNSIEILALILIIVAVIKLAIFLYKPTLWVDIVENMYSAPQLIAYIGLGSALVVLYFLVNAGLTIVEILAVSLFIALLMVTGLANYADEAIAWVREQDISVMLKKSWIYILAWILLIVWGVSELLINGF